MAQGGGEGEDARVKEQDAATRGAATPLGAFKVKESIVLDRGREGCVFFIISYSLLIISDDWALQQHLCLKFTSFTHGIAGNAVGR